MVDYFPRADMLLVAPDAKKLRASIGLFLPSIGLSMINYGRTGEVDRFYLDCQLHRDYYKDASGKTARQPGFERPAVIYQSRPNPNDVYVWQPIRYVRERRPVVYPLNVDRCRGSADGSKSIRLHGRTSGETDIKYKR